MKPKLCKGDMVKLLRCGHNAKERVAKVGYSNTLEFTPLVKLFGFLPIWVTVPGLWWLSDEGDTWTRLKAEEV